MAPEDMVTPNDDGRTNGWRNLLRSPLALLIVDKIVLGGIVGGFVLFVSLHVQSEQDRRLFVQQHVAGVGRVFTDILVEERVKFSSALEQYREELRRLQGSYEKEVEGAAKQTKLRSYLGKLSEETDRVRRIEDTLHVFPELREEVSLIHEKMRDTNIKLQWDIDRPEKVVLSQVSAVDAEIGNLYNAVLGAFRDTIVDNLMIETVSAFDEFDRKWRKQNHGS